MTEMATTSTQAPVLVIEAVSKRFPGVQALRDVSLVVNQAEVHALVGQKGAGKSTLVRCVSGVYAPDSGRIVLGGVEIRAYSPVRAYGLGIAAVHQRPQLVPWLHLRDPLDREITLSVECGTIDEAQRSRSYLAGLVEGRR